MLEGMVVSVTRSIKTDYLWDTEEIPSSCGTTCETTPIFEPFSARKTLEVHRNHPADQISFAQILDSRREMGDAAAEDLRTGRRSHHS